MRCCRYLVDKDEEGRIILDRDGSLFAHVLAYLRDGVLSVAEERCMDVGLLLKLRREFGYFAIELMEEQEVAFAVGGYDDGNFFSTVER